MSLVAKIDPVLRVLAFTSCAIAGGLIWSREHLRGKFKKTGYYQRTIKIVEANQTVGKLLGRPIKYGKLDLGDNTKFYATPEKAFVTLFASGPYDSGYLTSYCLRTPPSDSEAKNEIPGDESDDQMPNDGWEVMRLELRVSKHKDKRLIVFRKPEADEEFVNTFHDFYLKPAE